MMIEYLLSKRSEWWKLVRRYEEIRDTYQEQVEDAVLKRLAECVAVIHLSSEICHKKLGLPGDPEHSLDLLSVILREAARDTDMPLAALEATYSWASTNRRKFYNQAMPQADEPHGGWLGAWDSTGSVDLFFGWDWIGFAYEPLSRKLAEWGYDVDAVIASWRRRGYMILDADGKNPRRGPGRMRLLTIGRDSLRFFDS